MLKIKLGYNYYTHNYNPRLILNPYLRVGYNIKITLKYLEIKPLINIPPLPTQPLIKKWIINLNS